MNVKFNGKYISWTISFGFKMFLYVHSLWHITRQICSSTPTKNAAEYLG